jgi:hypothetical protein
MNGYFAPALERDSSNFDFRIVALFTMMSTRPELLREYLADGAAREPDGTPAALNDPTLWVTLRHLGLPPEMLAAFLFLFERDDVRPALAITQKLFATMVAIYDYCDLSCPLPDWYGRLVAYTNESCQPLNRPGVELEVQ